MAVCGSSTDFINIRDLGNGQCVSNSQVAPSTSFVAGNCTLPYFKTTCGSYAGFLNIFIGNDFNATALTYVPPNIEKWLTNIGLANVNVIDGNLGVFVDYSPFPIPSKIAPVFLSSLEQAGAVQASECNNQFCGAAPPPVPTGANYVLTALPGLKKLKQCTGVTAGAAFVSVYNTGKAFVSQSRVRSTGR